MSTRPNNWTFWFAVAGVFYIFTLRALAQNYQRVQAVGQIGGMCAAVDTAGNRAYVGVGPTLKILDVADPSSPVPVGRVLLHGVVGNVFVSSGTAYVVDGSLRIIDVSNPPLLKVLGSYGPDVWWNDYQNSAIYVYVSDGLAYLVKPYKGIDVLDVSNPSSPTLVGSYDSDTPDRCPVAVAVAGGFAYVATQAYLSDSGFLEIIDVSNPSSPKLRCAYDLLHSAWDIHSSGGLAYIANGVVGLTIIDVADPLSPELRGSCDTPGFAIGVDVKGGLAYVADSEAGLQIIDVSNPSRPQRRGNLDTPRYAGFVRASGNMAYVTDIDTGLQIIDVSNPTSPTLIGSDFTIGSVASAYTSGGLVYLGVEPYGNVRQFGALQIIDATVPSSPRYLGSCDLLIEARAVHVSGTTALVGMWHENIWGPNPGGLQIVDVSEPMAPTLRATYGTWAVYDVYAVGDLAYAAAGGSGLQILDVSDPSSPTLKGAYPLLREGLQLVDNLAYTGDYIIDVTDPTSPTRVGWCPVGFGVTDVYVDGDWGYYTAGERGLYVVDVSDPTSPVIVGSYHDWDHPWHEAVGVWARDGLAYVADSAGGLYVFDVSDPTSPTLQGHFGAFGFAGVACDADGLIYVPAGLSGLYILRYSPPLLEAGPAWSLYE